MLKTQAISQFLKLTGNKHLTSLYHYGMEVQVNVAQDDGVRIKGTTFNGRPWIGWKSPTSDETWKSFRIPWSAYKEPQYTDTEMKFDLIKHVEGIGLTGWNWVNKTSVWVGFDFDSIVNHTAGLTEEELLVIKQKLYELPYTTLIKSTSGKGLHLYIFFETPVPTVTHTEHAALARSVLSVIAAEVGYNLTTSVDTCGGVLWVYHRKQEGTDGLSLLKQGEKFKNQRIPCNWRDHADVVSGRKRRIIGLNKDEEISLFDEMTAAIQQQNLDDSHRQLLTWFAASAERDWWWDTDHNMLVCHTFDLKKAHTELGLKGIFYTKSTGTSAQNCYAFPSYNGSWIIRRHSFNVKEHPSWSLDASGWVRCVYNTVADFTVCAKSNEGVENTRGEYVFITVTQGLKALADLGITHIVIPEQYSMRAMSLAEKMDSRIVVSFTREPSDTAITGFLANSKGDRWECVVHRHKPKKEVSAPDYLIRHLITDIAEAGWFIYTRKHWVSQSKSNVQTVLMGQQYQYNKHDIELLMSKAILNPWKLVNIPFEDEYPGDRQWNRDGAAFSCKPEEGMFDTWLNILTHCGNGLRTTLEANAWCMQNNILNGADYLLCWVANAFQHPTEPLPYLFFVGEQNSGKSTFHEALALLFKQQKGYIRADNALINQQGFNSEIAGAIICVVEETDLKRNKDAANRIKDWVTGKTISINTKYKTVYDIVNTTKWIQCANDLNYCPILPGDTRIVVSWVEKPKTEIPKSVLFEKLEREKAAFLFHVLNLELPEPEGRLRLPCVTTSEKQKVMLSNSSDIEQFIFEHCKICYGKMTAFEDFCFAFVDWLSPEKRNYWTRTRVSREFPQITPLCRGRTGAENISVIGNLTLSQDEKDEVYELVTTSTNRIERRMRNL
jgi:energy-coupling factor transporter ATP-binding protein EcfA2